MGNHKKQVNLTSQIVPLNASAISLTSYKRLLAIWAVVVQEFCLASSNCANFSKCGTVRFLVLVAAGSRYSPLSRESSTATYMVLYLCRVYDLLGARETWHACVTRPVVAATSRETLGWLCVGLMTHDCSCHAALVSRVAASMRWSFLVVTGSNRKQEVASIQGIS